MARTFIIDIQANQDVSAHFVVAEKQLRTARNGSSFLTLKLIDKTGEITGRVWDNAEAMYDSIPLKEVVSLRGRSEKFRDEMQIHVQEISPVPVDRVNPFDFLPACPISAESLFENLKAVVATIKKRPLQQLMKALFGDRALMDRFKMAPAAKSMHHAYLGGLLEHTLAVARLAADLSEHYPELDRDLLIVGAVLHDIGKIDEFDYNLCIDYSHAGRLLGHMVLGIQILDEKLKTLKNFPVEDAMLLKHLILSHHGEAEFGAVKLPMTREAFMLHYADDLDAKMNTLTRIISDPRNGDEAWTNYQTLFSRHFLRGLPCLGNDGAAAAEEGDDQAVQLNLWSPGKAQKKPGV